MADKKTMLVNAADPDEVRVAVLKNGFLDELYVETSLHGAAVGNIYKGVISNLDKSLDAAFVNIGTLKHGFLHISDVSIDGSPPKRLDEEGAKRVRDFLTSGREVIVQVKKEGVGNKGPALTMFVGIPGRHLVIMPHLGRIGVSRRIKNRDTRVKLKSILEQIDPPKKIGFVIRTEARGTTEPELRIDVKNLLARWENVTESARQLRTPGILWQEADLVVRALRDHLSGDTNEIWLDTSAAYERAKEFLVENEPGLEEKAMLHAGPASMFAHFGVERQLAELGGARVDLRGGGYLIIEQTEAMAVVDVNSGRTKKRKGVSTMIRRTNMQAAAEIARQLRLRDIGGLVVIDFIDMEIIEDRRDVENELAKHLQPDKARTTVLPISELGVLEMTRQRRRLGFERSTSSQCPVCAGLGRVRSVESLSVAFLRELRSFVHNTEFKPCTELGMTRLLTSRLHPERTLAVANHVRPDVAEIESSAGVEVEFMADNLISYDSFAIELIKKPVPATRRPSAYVTKQNLLSSEETPAVNEKTKTAAPEAKEVADKKTATKAAPKTKKKTKKARSRKSKIAASEKAAEIILQNKKDEEAKGASEKMPAATKPTASTKKAKQKTRSGTSVAKKSKPTNAGGATANVAKQNDKNENKKDSNKQKSKRESGRRQALGAGKVSRKETEKISSVKTQQNKEGASNEVKSAHTTTEESRPGGKEAKKILPVKKISDEFMLLTEPMGQTPDMPKKPLEAPNNDDSEQEPAPKKRRRRRGKRGGKRTKKKSGLTSDGVSGK